MKILDTIYIILIMILLSSIACFCTSSEATMMYGLFCAGIMFGSFFS